MSLIASPARLLTGPSLRERAKYSSRRNAGGKARKVRSSTAERINAARAWRSLKFYCTSVIY